MPDKRAVKFIEDDQGRKLLVEVSESEEIEIIDDGNKRKGEFKPASVADFKEYANSLTELISNTTEAILSSVALPKVDPPSKVQAEFGVELGGEGKIWFVAKGSAKATIKVSLEWDNLRQSNAEDAQSLES
jgi:hypothetical protein